MPNRPNIENIVESNVNGVTNPMDSNIISSAVSNALNRTTDDYQFSQILNNLNNQNKNSSQIRSAPNSPQLQSQISIPLIDIAIMPKRFPQVKSAYEKIDTNIIDKYLPDDLKIFLLYKLRHKLQPFTNDVNKMAQHMLNFDDIQIITALNDSEFITLLIGRINQEMILYQSLDENQQQTVSLWNSYLEMFGGNSEKHKMDVKVLENEIKQINTPSKQKKHLLFLVFS